MYIHIYIYIYIYTRVYICLRVLPSTRPCMAVSSSPAETPSSRGVCDLCRCMTLYVRIPKVCDSVRVWDAVCVFVCDSVCVWGSSAKVGTIQGRLAWPLRRDDTRDSRRVNIMTSVGVSLRRTACPRRPRKLQAEKVAPGDKKAKR